MKKIIAMVLLVVISFTACSPNKESGIPISVDVSEAGSLNLRGSGKLRYKFTQPLDKKFVDEVSQVYFRKASNENLQKEDLLSEGKYRVTKGYINIPTDNVKLNPSEQVKYELVLIAGDVQKLIELTIIQMRPKDFTIRLIDKSGNVIKSKTFTYDEMKAMATSKSYYTGVCVMHGLFSFKAEGVYLKDLFQKSDIEFKDGMSFACRVVDAKTKVKVSEKFSSVKTGEVVDNPERYWMLPRFTDDYKQSYKKMYGTNRYFVTAQWEDEAVGKILTDDGGKFGFEARSALVKNSNYLQKVEPMIAMKVAERQYQKDAVDIRTLDDNAYGLFEDEVGFRFLFGAAMDDDPVTNVIAYDKDQKKYPVTVTPEYKGRDAIEEGHDPCGTAGRMAKWVFGIDVFENAVVEKKHVETKVVNQKKLVVSNQNSGLYKDGEYIESAYGYVDMIKVKVIIENGNIKKIEIMESSEDTPYIDMAEDIIDAIIKKNSCEVDTITGATFSSSGIKKAVEKALKKASFNK